MIKIINKALRIRTSIKITDEAMPLYKSQIKRIKPPNRTLKNVLRLRFKKIEVERINQDWIRCLNTVIFTYEAVTFKRSNR